MDPHFVPTREEFYHVQMDIKHVQAVQTNHTDRLLRLEKRQADDAALKSVWGTVSPFPSVLSGTPQHGPQNPSNDVFDDFDDDEGHNLLGSLQLETDEEPVRRGASRANSVRFDVSALQGSNWAQGSRVSGDFAPTRPSSGFGSHPMTERSLSHKSDGRHSSAGHSVHSVHSMHSVPSGRTSSLGLDTNFMIGGNEDNSPIDSPDPPPGLFILGPVPSIIRCWLTTSFSHNALLYAVICTGSRKSILDYSLVKDLGLLEQIQKGSSGSYTVRVPIYLPEAIITQPLSRPNSPAPQLPALTAEFEITGFSSRAPVEKKAIRVFIGSDTLRAHNADVLFSQNLMTIYGDDRVKLSVPFVRPEDENTFKNLCVSNMAPEKIELKATATPFTPNGQRSTLGPQSDSVTAALKGALDHLQSATSTESQYPTPTTQPQSPALAPLLAPDFSSLDELKSSRSIETLESSDQLKEAIPTSHEREPASAGRVSSDLAQNEISSASGGIWGSWRNTGTSLISGSENGREPESISGYQRATRSGYGRSMKILKPSKSQSLASTNSASNTASSGGTRPPTTRSSSAYEPAPPISFNSSRGSMDSSRRKASNSISNAENTAPLRWDAKRTSLDEQRRILTTSSVQRTNPIGGASAFAWMNPSSIKGKDSSPTD